MHMSPGKAVVSRSLPQDIESSIVSWSPTMDLLAIFSTNGILWIYRGTTGQRVWAFPLKPTSAALPKVSNISVDWSSDGHMLVVCGNGINGYKIYDVIQGKLILDMKNPAIINFNKQNNNRKLHTIQWVSMNHKEIAQHKTDTQIGLMEDLLSYNVIDSMPKLAPLPTTNTSHILSSKFAMDGMVSDYDTIVHNVLIMAKDRNSIDIIFNGFFDITDVKYSFEDYNIKWLKIHDMGNYRYALTCQLTNYNKQSQVACINLSLPINDDEYIRQIISCSTQITLNFLYLYEVVAAFQTDCKTFIEFNNKMLSLLDSDLNANSFEKFSYISSQLYELLLTGMMSDNLRYWVENHLGDKNIKKWSKLGNACFDQLKHKILTLFVPSSQRCIILLLRLRSLCMWRLKRKKDALAVNIENIDEHLRKFKEITTKIYIFAINSNHEQKLFNCFINWLTDILEHIKDEDSKKLNDNIYYNISEISEYITKNLNTNLRILEFLHLDENLHSEIHNIGDNYKEMINKVKSRIKSKIVFSDPIPINMNEVNATALSSQKLGDKIFYVSYNSDQVIMIKDNTGNFSKVFNVQQLLLKYESKIKGVEIINDEEIVVVAGPANHKQQDVKEIENLKENEFIIIMKLNIYMDDDNFSNDTNPNNFQKIENCNIVPENISFNSRNNSIVLLSSKKFAVLCNLLVN